MFSEGIADLYRFIRKQRKYKSIFTGSYSNWNDVKDENPWEGDGWFNKSKLKLEQSEIYNNSDLSIPPNPTYNSCYAIPPLLVNLICERRVCNVLDFAGGTGDVYYKIKRSLNDLSKLNWFVTDNSKLMELGKSFAKEDDPIHYSSSIPDEKYDLILTSTCLQYMENYKELVGKLISFKPKYILFMRLWSGDYSKDLITTENVFGKKTPSVIINFDDLNNFLQAHNYKILFKGPCTLPLHEGQFTDIPSDFRPLYDVNVVFSKCM